MTNERMIFMKKASYETNITKLREIVEKLESGDASLEESLKLFEQGIKLSTSCYETLKKAEQRITELSEIEKEHDSDGDNE